MRRDAAGRPCSDVRLLLMGTLHSDTTNVSNVVNQSNSNISANVHQLLLLQWRKDMASNKEEFISMPLNEEELDRITSDFEAVAPLSSFFAMA